MYVQSVVLRGDSTAPHVTILAFSEYPDVIHTPKKRQLHVWISIVNVTKDTSSPSTPTCIEIAATPPYFHHYQVWMTFFFF